MQTVVPDLLRDRCQFFRRFLERNARPEQRSRIKSGTTIILE